MRVTNPSAAMVAIAFAIQASACGSGRDSSDASGAQGTGGSSTNSSGVGGAQLGPSDGGPSGIAPDAACVTASATAHGAPAYLVFMFDRSCSMGDSVGTSTKWDACKAGLDAFFASAATSGLSASLQFFPTPETGDPSCDSAAYSKPDVPMRQLPDAATFGGAIDSSPLVCGTPTVPALQGAIDYAKTVSAQNAGGKVAVVLVTDGLPDMCDPGSVSDVANVAAATANTIPTYVIGIGDALANLNAIAQAGGTNAAILVSTQSPDQVTGDLVSALGTVQSSVVACTYTLPPPPSGETLDTNKVNVLVTQNQMASTLGYNPDCQGGEGWHYDSTAAPTQIVICPTSCTSLEKDSTAKIDIYFGCTTQTAVPK